MAPSLSNTYGLPNSILYRVLGPRFVDRRRAPLKMGLGFSLLTLRLWKKEQIYKYQYAVSLTVKNIMIAEIVYIEYSLDSGAINRFLQNSASSQV